MVLFGKRTPDLLTAFLTAKCPACGCTALARTWTLVESHYDGKREEAVPVGGHYICDDCGCHCRVTAGGVVRIGATPTAPPPVEESSKHLTPPSAPANIPVRFPKG
jgi:hypothetical protein